MFSFFIIYLLVALLLMAIPCVLIYKVVRKSLKKPDAAGLLNEKAQMRHELYAKKHILQPWNDESIALINNNINYIKSKSITRQARGTMNTFDNTPLLVFKLIECGLTEDGHMYVVSSSFDLYVRYTPASREFYYNGNLLGNLSRGGSITNAQGIIIGHAYRIKGNRGYDINIHNKKLAHILKAKDLDNTRRNPFFDLTQPRTSWNVPYHKTERVIRQNMVKPAESILSEDEKQWITAIALFESIYYSTYII